MEPAYSTGFHPTIKHRSGEPMAVDYTSKQDASSDMQAAAARAQEMNQQPGGVTVYYAVIPNNASKHTLQSTLDWVLNRAKKTRKEMAVSVKRGLWMGDMVLVGNTKHLIGYWDTDIRSKEVPGMAGAVMPTQAHRPSQERHYDEGIVRYSDVEWHTLYYDPDDEFIMSQVGDHDSIVQIASQYGLEVKPLPKGGTHAAMTGRPDPESGEVDPLVMGRHQLELTMRSLVSKNAQWQQMIAGLCQDVLGSPDNHDPKTVQTAQEIHQQVSKLDVTHKELVNYADRRLLAMKKTMTQLRLMFQHLQDLTHGTGVDNFYNRDN